MSLVFCVEKVFLFSYEVIWLTMKFFDHQHEPLQNFERADEMIKIAEEVKNFVPDCCPEEWKPQVEKNFAELSCIITSPKGEYQIIVNGVWL